ncbi:hypothetical protein CHS0354_032420 [Potamilus streckersoni]|uniref:Uncharacterized protein n=1 Tax=Potamilus streckersoni TaxID=2493646 RepID=A0AAE0SQ04_9BIVA|nr:hypothetical protein CHS0354_032420 [Potamilus streckersoni]
MEQQEICSKDGNIDPCGYPDGDKTDLNMPLRQVVSNDDEAHCYLILTGYRNVFESLLHLPTPCLPFYNQETTGRLQRPNGN